MHKQYLAFDMLDSPKPFKTIVPDPQRAAPHPPHAHTQNTPAIASPLLASTSFADKVMIHLLVRAQSDRL